MAEETSLITPQRVEQGRWIYCAWKYLRAFPVAQIPVAFEATALAGKACDLLGRMRQLAPYTLTSLLPLARDAGISRRELSETLVPVLGALGILSVERRVGAVASVKALVISQDDVMDQTARIWEHLDPDPVERGALVVLQATATLPLEREEATQACEEAGLSGQQAEQAVELALAHQLVLTRYVADFGAEFLYNDFLWGENIERTVRALAALPSQVREGLRSLLEELHEHEGRPTNELESASPDLAQLAVTRGLIDATEITTADNRKATFHFTPRFRGFGVSREIAPDALDQVKLVIASFAFSTRYARYKLRNPEVFLDSLIDRGYAGKASPIATDYGALERQKIVDVEPVLRGSDRYRFRALKKDTLIEARDTMRAGALLVPSPRGLAGGGFYREPQSFTDPVKVRQELARESGKRPLYDAELLAAIRDAAQQDTFK